MTPIRSLRPGLLVTLALAALFTIVGDTVPSADAVMEARDVVEVSIAPRLARLEPGGTVSVDVTLDVPPLAGESDGYERGIGAFDIKVGYDPAVLAVVDCPKPALGFFYQCEPAFADGTVRISGSSRSGEPPITGHVIVTTLTFEAVGAEPADPAHGTRVSRIRLSVDLIQPRQSPGVEPITARTSDGRILVMPLAAPP
jgi:hypothetical protein